MSFTNENTTLLRGQIKELTSTEAANLVNLSHLQGFKKANMKLRSFLRTHDMVMGSICSA